MPLGQVRRSVLALILLAGCASPSATASPPPAPSDAPSPSSVRSSPSPAGPTPTPVPIVTPVPVATPDPRPTLTPQPADPVLAAEQAVAAVAADLDLRIEARGSDGLRISGVVADDLRAAVVAAIARVPGIRVIDASDLEPSPASVVVAPGDTLWTIAVRAYGDGREWRRLAEANPGLDPRALAVGAVVFVPSLHEDSGTVGQTWDPVADFALGGRPMNPGPDDHGNDAVWSYLHNHGYVHDPSAYVPMRDLDNGYWLQREFLYLLVGREPNGQELRMHDYGGDVINDIRSPVLAWRSPITGLVELSGQVRTGSPDCLDVGTGVVFWIDRGDATLYRIALPVGGIEPFDLQARVVEGESIYLILEPGFDARCDTTFVRLRIERV